MFVSKQKGIDTLNDLNIVNYDCEHSLFDYFKKLNF